MVLNIPPGPRHRGYAKTRVEVRQLLDGRYRVYFKGDLLLEITPPGVQAPLRTLRQRHPRMKTPNKRSIPKAMTRNDRVKSRLTHDLGGSNT